MKSLHVAVAALATMVSFAGVAAVQAGGYGYHKPRFTWTFTTNPAVPGRQIGTESNPPTPFGTCKNLAGVQQAGTADSDGFCIPASSLVGSVAGFSAGTDASCTVTVTKSKHEKSWTVFEETFSGECPTKPERPPFPSTPSLDNRD